MGKIYTKSFKKSIKKKSTDAKQNVKLATLSRKVNALSEYKYTRTSQTAVIFSNTAPYTQLLNGMVTGDDKYSRSGVRLECRNIDILLTLYNSNNTFTNDNFIRVVLLREKPNLGSTVLSLTSLFDTTTPTHMTPFNMNTRDFKKRFTILYNRVVNTWNGSNLAQITVNIKKRVKFIVDYSRSNVGTGADIDTNAIYLCVISDKVAGSPSTLSLKYDGLITYLDA